MIELGTTSSHHLDVLKFSKKFGCLINEVPALLTDRKLMERHDFMQEELNEFSEAVSTCDLVGQADALVDIVYVAIGTAIAMGLPWDKLWDDVQRANMEKVRGVGTRGNLVDCIKPKGWTPPMTEDILMLASTESTGAEPLVDDAEYLESNNSQGEE